MLVVRRFYIDKATVVLNVSSSFWYYSYWQNIHALFVYFSSWSNLSFEFI